MNIIRFFILFLGVILLPLNSFAADQSKTIRIGYQKEGSLFLLKLKGDLDYKFKDKNIRVEWVQFLSGPQLLEALNANAIDFGETGETPPVFAQAAGVKFVYVGNEPAKPGREAIIVPENSSIQSIKDLKGKKVAFNKGSNVQYLVVKALEKAGLSYSDIHPVYLTPSDGLAAFQSRHVDALATWDPFLAIAEHQLPTKRLTDGHGLVNNYEFYIASKEYVEQHPEVITALLMELNDFGQWMNLHHSQVVEIMTPALGLSKDVTNEIVARDIYGATPISDKVRQEQQIVADTFAKIHLIPQTISVEEAVWKTR